MFGLAFEKEELDIARASLLVLILSAGGRHRGWMSDREHGQRLRHLRMPRGEEPGDDRAPVVARDVRRLTAEGFDEPGHILDQVVDGVALFRVGRVGEPVAAKIRRHREVAGLRERIDLPRPRLCAFGEPMQKDEEVGLRRAVDQRPEP